MIYINLNIFILEINDIESFLDNGNNEDKMDIDPPMDIHQPMDIDQPIYSYPIYCPINPTNMEID